MIKKNKKKTENRCQNAARENIKTTSEICNFDSNKKVGPDELQMDCENYLEKIQSKKSKKQ